MEEIANQMSVMFVMGIFTEKTDSHILSVFKKTALEFYGKVRIGVLKLKENNTRLELFLLLISHSYECHRIDTGNVGIFFFSNSFCIIKSNPLGFICIFLCVIFLKF